MSNLKSLSFTTLPKVEARPAIKRRAKIIARLEEQKLLLADPSYCRKVQKWVTKDGKRELTDKQQRLTPWWQMDQNGAYVLTLRVGSRAVEFEKGKSAISIASVDKIPSVIDTLVRAIKAGELDEQLSHTGKVPKATAATKKAA